MLNRVRSLFRAPNQADGAPPAAPESARQEPEQPARLSNFEYNRQLWDRYARDWDAQWANIEDPQVSAEERAAYLRFVGDEWGRVRDVEQVVAEFILPFVDAHSLVGEIGVGGGRVAAKVIPNVGEFVCFDIAPEMLNRAREALVAFSNVRYELMDGPRFPCGSKAAFDFLYAFDVFVHFDVHLLWRYFNLVREALKPGGRMLVHTTNLRAPLGWERFAGQESYSVEGHYFVTPELVLTLAERAGVRLLKASQADPANFYYNRDYLAVFET